jgi:hypothetical protein
MLKQLKPFFSYIIPMGIMMVFLLPVAYFCGTLEAAANPAAPKAPVVYVMAAIIGFPLFIIVFMLSSKRGKS